MKKSAKWILVVAGILFVVFIGLILAGKINLFPQLVIFSGNGDIELDCDSFASCSPLLKDMGYTDDEVIRILTSCNSQGCEVMK